MQRKRFALILGALALFAVPALGLAQFFEKPIEDYDALFRESLSKDGKTMNLSGKKIGDEGIKKLIAFGPVKSVVKLDLRYNKIAEEGARAMAQSGAFPALEFLELRHNFFGDGGAAALAESQAFPKLLDLKLGWNELHDPGGLALAGSKTLAQTLKKLDLRGNFLDEPTKQALSKAYAHLESLQLF
ncbi:MAG: hypothetical protein HY579_08740 [Nitrospinae bacterium]|nr:hypothetical protein [Nitrospinota bacterium]